MRKICYVSGTRADYGLIARTLKKAKASTDLQVSVCVTGMHLLSSYGETVREIEADGLRICARVPVHLDGTSGGVMAKAIGHEIIGFVDAFESENPDAVVVLGDRGEMLAGAIAATHLNIPVIHIHGGERSGTVDEPVRHAISKLAHYHLVTTEAARVRLIRMGERPEHIFVVGAPGLDDIHQADLRPRNELFHEMRFDPTRPVALVIFHPVLQEADQSGDQVEAILRALTGVGLQLLCLEPNADAGGHMICQRLRSYRGHPDVRCLTHLERNDYISWMAAVDVMVGNSSSGIIEAASVGLPVINVGNRQWARERSKNTIDVAVDEHSIRQAVLQVLQSSRGACRNVYGDGRASDRIVELLEKLPLTNELLAKTNVY